MFDFSLLTSLLFSLFSMETAVQFMSPCFSIVITKLAAFVMISVALALQSSDSKDIDSTR